MKKVKIEKLSYKVLELTPRSKKVKKVEFTFTIEGKEYKECSDDLSKEWTLFVFIPFVYDSINYPGFKKETYNRQIEILNAIVHVYTDHELKVGSAGRLLFNLNFEWCIKEFIKNNKTYFFPNPCLTSEGEKEMYVDYPEKTKFHIALINYYTLGYEDQDFNVNEFFYLRKLKLKNLNKNLFD